MTEKDIRWLQRLSNYEKALNQLSNAATLAEERKLSDLEEQGLIQAFEFTHELAWNLMRDYFEYQGTSSITGSRDATREAFNKGLILDGEGWMEMIKSRNKTSHTYNEDTAEEIVNNIKTRYHHLLVGFKNKMKDISAGEAGDIFTNE